MIEPISPDQVLTEEELLQSRIEEIKKLFNKLWPDHFDYYPIVSSHFEEELDAAIRLLNQRRKQFTKNRPKRTRGGQVKWDIHKYKGLLCVDGILRERKLSRDSRLEKLSEIFGIGEKKIEERLKQARESVKS